MGEQLTTQQRTGLRAVLDRYPEVFDDSPGFTHVIEHKIEVMDQTPIYQRPYRIPESQRDVVERELLNMVQPGIIRYNTESLWSSPLVVVKKQDGYIRLVNNFIDLNKVTVNEPTCMNNVLELVYRVVGAKLVSRRGPIDLRAAYFQVGLHTDSPTGTKR